MSTSISNIKLRAFRIENPSLTSPNSGLLPMLKKVLENGTTAQSRRLKLNEQDDDEDLLASYKFVGDGYLFGMMLRIIPNTNGAIINDVMFSNKIITISDLESGDNEHHQYKNHFYIAVNNTHVVTNLSGNHNIICFQTYLNWLLEDIRKQQYFDLTPVVKIPEGVKLSDISSVEFSSAEGRGVPIPTQPNGDNIVSQIKEVTNEMLKQLLSSTDNLSELQKEQLVSAKLLLKFKKKPKEMQDEEYQKIMGAMTKQLTDDQGFIVKGKNGQKLTGKEIKVVKEVKVEKTDKGNISEPHLQQEMEKFLTSLIEQ